MDEKQPSRGSHEPLAAADREPALPPLPPLNRKAQQAFWGGMLAGIAIGVGLAIALHVIQQVSPNGAACGVGCGVYSIRDSVLLVLFLGLIIGLGLGMGFAATVPDRTTAAFPEATPVQPSAPSA